MTVRCWRGHTPGVLNGVPPRTGRGRARARVLRLASAAAAGVVAFVVLDWAAVHTVSGRLVDGRSLRGALLTESPAASLLERVLDLISVTALLGAVIVILAVAVAAAAP